MPRPAPVIRAYLSPEEVDIDKKFSAEATWTNLNKKYDMNTISKVLIERNRWAIDRIYLGLDHLRTALFEGLIKLSDYYPGTLLDLMKSVLFTK